MRRLLPLAALLAVALLGCGGGDEGEKTIAGPKPEIKETPPGTVAPGDVRPDNPANSSGEREGDR